VAGVSLFYKTHYASLLSYYLGVGFTYFKSLFAPEILGELSALENKERVYMDKQLQDEFADFFIKADLVKPEGVTGTWLNKLSGGFNIKFEEHMTLNKFLQTIGYASLGRDYLDRLLFEAQEELSLANSYQDSLKNYISEVKQHQNNYREEVAKQIDREYKLNLKKILLRRKLKTQQKLKKLKTNDRYKRKLREIEEDLASIKV
jgi:hypothetical protein